MRNFGLGKAVRSFAGVVVGPAVLLAGLTGCREEQQPRIVTIENGSPDPADANMAPVMNAGYVGSRGTGDSVYVPAQGSRRLLMEPSGRVLGARMTNVAQQQVTEYPQGAPIERRAPQGVPASTGQPSTGYSDQGYGDQGYSDPVSQDQ